LFGEIAADRFASGQNANILIAIPTGSQNCFPCGWSRLHMRWLLFGDAFS
jgi:hypothetical protein